MPPRSLLLTLFIMALTCATVTAQPPATPPVVEPPGVDPSGRDPHAAHGGAATADAEAAQAAERWRVQVDASAFFGYNYQRREFTDFDAVESQNWFMAAANRRLGASSLTLTSMFSLEPFTLQDLGSPQAFQTGETFEGAPLIDYQHPHDLVMALGARVDRPMRRVRLRVEASLVGSPALGPPPFMHRPSAADNPQAPLSHHGLDSTHVSTDVLTGGLSWRGLMWEASWFHGREPDEDRLDLDFGAPDSWATRLSWQSGPWRVQLSGGRLKQPETVHPYDETRLTASAGYDGLWRTRPVSVLLAWGQKREPFGVFDNYLLETHTAIGARDAIYTRSELVTKALLGGGVHSVGAVHQHPHSRIGAFTSGYVRDVLSGPRGRVGVGADVTVYRVPANLTENYGRPLSFHVFVRYAMRPTAMAGMHH